MASDEDTQVTGIRKIINQVQNMLRRPQLNNDLSEALDAFIKELTVNNHYLRNGIFTMKFAEFGIFLQVTVELYSKQVDILWEDTLHYHVKLCSYNQLSSPQNALEAEKITERINRNKRKKIVQKIVQNSVLSENLLDDLKKSTNILHACETITKSDFLKNAWKEVNRNPSKQTTNSKLSKPLTSFQFSTNQSIRSLNGDKLGNYHDLFLNHITPYLGSFNKEMESENITYANNKDFLLQRYLKHKGISYKKFCLNKLAEEFNLFKKRIQQIDALLPIAGISNGSIANISRLPEELMTENPDENVDQIRSMVQDLLVKERQGFASRIKKSSERISDVDSAFHDETFMDTESEPSPPAYTSQQSNVDSGIFENVPSCESIMSENNLSCTNVVPEDIIEETITADDIPQYDSILNSTNDSVNVDSIGTVETVLKDNSLNCSIENPLEVTTEVVEVNANANTRPAPVHITTFTVFQPLVQEDEPRLKAQKRKLLKNDDDDSPPVKQKRAPKFKWLKTTTTTLRKFENFFLQHYVAEDDEADANREILLEDDTEDEGDFSICADNDHLVENDVEVLHEVIIVEETPSATTNSVEVPSSTPVHNSITEYTTNIELEFATNIPEPTQNDELPISSIEIETTNRMKAINEWRNFIEPKLKQMEKKSEFDIHEFGSQIMDAIPEGKNLHFKDMVSGKSSSDVCKLFLASLQLANTSNIEIIPPEQGKLANETLRFKLLTRERYHEHLDDYEAPSENSIRERLARVRASCPSEFTQSNRILNYSNNAKKRLRLSR